MMKMLPVRQATATEAAPSATRAVERELGHLLGGLAHGGFGGRFEGDDERQIQLVLVRQLEYGLDADVFGGQDARQRGDDSRLVDDAKPHVVGALLEGDGDGLVFAQALMRERRDARGAAEQNLARHPHQVAHHSRSGGSRPGAAAVVERVLAVGPLHPDGVVGTAYAGQDGGLGNQRRTHR